MVWVEARQWLDGLGRRGGREDEFAVVQLGCGGGRGEVEGACGCRKSFCCVYLSGFWCLLVLDVVVVGR